MARDNKVLFTVPNRTPGSTLVLDPVLVYSTYFGGSQVVDINNCGSVNLASGIAVDPAGNFYITGLTDTFDFPVTPNAFMKKGVSDFECLATPMDGFVTKFSSSGKLLYSTYISGDEGLGYWLDQTLRIAVDGNGIAYLVGTAQQGFPTTANAYQRICAEDASTPCAFLAKLNAAGSDLLYATYFGGRNNPESSSTSATGIALGKNGNVYMVGHTTDFSFPTTAGAYGSSCTSDQYNFIDCGFAARFNTNAGGSQSLIFSTLIGHQQTTATAIAVDRYGDAYVVGTSNLDLPKLASFGKGNSSYVLKLNGSNGSARRAATILKGATPASVAVDGLLNVFVAGSATAGLATTAGAFQTTFRGGESDGFVTKISPSGYNLLFSTFIGGTHADSVNAIAVNGNGVPFLTGTTYSGDFPTNSGAFKKTFGLLYDFSHSGFVAALNSDGKSLSYSSYLGGASYTDALAIAIDTSSNAYVSGFTADSDFPVTPGAFRSYHSAVLDAIVSKVTIAGDLRTTVKTSATSVPKNTTVIYNARVYNAGPDGSDKVVFTDPIPAGMSYAGVYMPDGTVCTEPMIGATSGTLSCRKTRLNSGQTWYVNVYLRAVGASQSKTTNRMTATAGTADLWPTNNSVSAVVTIQ
jgi:uncharacterized repeat protein (TIGR01451 family)